MFFDLTPHVLVFIAVLYGALILATGIIYGLAWSRPQKNFSELKKRIGSWWIIILVFTGSLAGSNAVRLTFLGLVSFLALREYCSLIPTRRADRRIVLWCYIAIPIQFYWIAIQWYSLFLIFIPVYMFLFLPLRMVTIGETSGFLNAAGTLHWGLMSCVFSLSHIAYLFMLPSAAAKNPLGGGAGLVLYLVVMTELNDVAQYCWGKLLGRHKVIPKVSPGKTVEGLVGGILTTSALSLLAAPYLTALDFPHSLYSGLLISIAGFVGDVVISAIKRDIGVKDSGSILPGHGGLLDRVDSLTYTAPLFFHFINYLF